MNGRIECPLETAFRDAGYVQVYDGQFAQQKRNEQFPMPPEERRFFVRHYRQVKNNKFTNKWIKFVYDLRKKECVNFCMTNKDLEAQRTQEMTITSKGNGHAKTAEEMLSASTVTFTNKR